MASSSSSMTDEEKERLTIESSLLTDEEKKIITVNSLPVPVVDIDLQSALQAIEQGKDAFRKNLVKQAFLLFKDALTTLMQIYGRLDVECARVYYLVAIAKLYAIPFSNKDIKFTVLPLEADQYLAYNDKVEKTFKVKKGNARVGDLSESWMLLRCAFTCASAQEGKSMLKAEILSACGEAGYRLGDDRAYIYYKEAWTNLAESLEETDIRNILLKLKMGICLEKTSKEKALQVYEQALKLYEKRVASTHTHSQQGSEKESEKDIKALNKLYQLIKFEIRRLGNLPSESPSNKRRISDVITTNEFANKYYRSGGLQDIRKYWEKKSNPLSKTRFNAEALAPKTEIPPANRIVTRAGKAASMAATRPVTRSVTRATKSRSTK